MTFLGFSLKFYISTFMHGVQSLVWQSHILFSSGLKQKEYRVRVIDTWKNQEEYTLDMGKYFYGEGITSVATDDSVVVSTTTDTEYSFINPVIADGFEMKFAITKGDFNRLLLVLEDSVDSSAKIEIEIDRAFGNVNFPFNVFIRKI